LVALAAVVWVPGSLRANETWLLMGEAGASMALNEPQKSAFGPGGSAVLSGYRSFGPLMLLGLRLRGGAFTEGTAVRPDGGMGGIGALTAAARLSPFARPGAAGRAVGFWLEAGGGAGLTGSLARPVAEAGAGIGFLAGPTILSPFVRYLHVVQSGSGPAGADAQIGLFGLEVAWFDRSSLPKPRQRMALLPIPPDAPPGDTDGDGILNQQDQCAKTPEDIDQFEDQDGCPEDDNDRDGIADASDKCPMQPEVVNGVDDADGCPDTGEIEMVADRVVLDDTVLFRTERARVTTAGQKILSAVIAMWKQHPDWDRMEVEGHSDQRGPDEFNKWLSEERAQRVRKALIGMGFPESKITARGFGATRPRTSKDGREGLSQNRRVELVVLRKAHPKTDAGPAATAAASPGSGAPAPEPPLPPADLAPEPAPEEPPPPRKARTP
jgi:outer membrane protein OmpA-like peptidoglycan-associated protein